MDKLKIKRFRENRIFSAYICRALANPRGFTLTEIVMVIILLGIVAVSVIPKFLDTSAFSLEGAAAVVVADIRYAQELAMSSNKSKKVDFTQGSSTYTLKDWNDIVLRTVKLPSGVTVSSSNITFEFNSLGEPLGCSGACGAECCDKVELTVPGSSPTKNIWVDSITGRVSSS